ncbi:MAG TPA: hypothetical protein VMS56_15560 [Thermoanaerobaculia bacterium]|nr:hypothetical protein [Thermoanaerobaculia bacterium]
MSELPEERRRFQRLELASPIPATFENRKVRLFEVGLVGALIEHEGRLESGHTGILAFDWVGERLEFECRVVRTREGIPREGEEAPFYSGLEVVAAVDDSDRRLRRMIAEHVTRVVAAQEANAFGDRERNLIDPDHTLTALGSARRAIESGFITWRYLDGKWKKGASLLPDQPPDGFTVAAWEEDEQLARLRKAYEQADAEGRHFLRMLAELSIAEARGIPPKKE